MVKRRVRIRVRVHGEESLNTVLYCQLGTHGPSCFGLSTNVLY